MKRIKIPRVLTIAGSDSSGGAGIQADLKTIFHYRCYGMSVITAVTAQNTQGVVAIEQICPEIVQRQFRCVVDDVGVDVIKIGMLLSAKVTEILAKEIERLRNVPLIIDPVMTSTSGFKLTTDKAMDCMVKTLFPLSLLITPNLFEAQILTERTISTDAELEQVGIKLLSTGAKNVLIKGGHRDGKYSDDCLISSEGASWYRQKSIITTNTHGTGCTLSTAIACLLAKGYPLSTAVRNAKLFITQCLLTFTDVKLGQGHGAVFPIAPIGCS